MVAKHRQSPYVPGQRSPFWLKVKAVKSDDFVVVGWMGERPYDALVVGFYEDGRLLPCGTVGGGWDDEAARFVRTRLAELASDATVASIGSVRETPSARATASASLLCPLAYSTTVD